MTKPDNARKGAAPPPGKRVPVAPVDRIAFDTRFEAVMTAAEQSGLLSDRSSRIGGRVSPRLVDEAKKRSGISTDSELIAFALANIALQDDFALAFKESRGTVDADLHLGYD